MMEIASATVGLRPRRLGGDVVEEPPGSSSVQGEPRPSGADPAPHGDAGPVRPSPAPGSDGRSAIASLAPSGAVARDDRQEQLRQLYEAHYTDLVRLACLLLDRTEAAEEVVQDAFVKLYGALDRIEDRDATPAYLRSVVMNGARSALRHRRVVRRHPPVPEPPGEAADATALLREDQREVIDALRTLPRRQRECLVLRYYAGCSEAEIAETLGIARGTVKSSTARAMATLTERLEGRR